MEAPPDPVSSTSRGTILLIDDEEMVQEMNQTMLHRLGFSTLTAKDGREGVALFRKNADRIICCIIDLTMPHLDGFGTFEEIRRIKNDAVIILSSGFSEKDATIRFAGKRLNGFLQKPFTIRLLDEELKRIFPPTGDASKKE